MNFFKKILFIINKPDIILISGDKNSLTSLIIYKLLKQKFKDIRVIKSGFPYVFNRRSIFIFPIDFNKFFKYKFILEKSYNLIIINNISFSEENDKQLFVKFLKNLKSVIFKHYIIINIDNDILDELSRRLKNNLNILTYSLKKEADFQVSDLNIDNKKLNFKIINEGDIVPLWININFKDKIDIIIVSIIVAKLKGMNLVEISQILKDVL